MDWLLAIIIFLVAATLGGLAHYYISQIKAESAKKSAFIILRDANKEAEVILKEAKISAKDEVIKAREDFDKEVKERKREVVGLEERFMQRETNLDRKVSMLDKKELVLEKKLDSLEQNQKEHEVKKKEMEELIVEQRQKLQDIAQLSQKDAKEILMKELQEEIEGECGAMIRHIQEEAKNKAEREARKIITMAIERYAVDQVNDVTTSSVSLPNDEMKGRIIGKEGRNIRSIEGETGVNILIDETPEVVVISGFDPLRREIARLTLERLISDGRIHPARIEEVVQKVREDLNDVMQEAGEQAILELGLRGVSPDIVRMLGRLKFRNSFSQNVLKHSIEMAHLLGNMASELRLEPMIAKRIGLFHDIGKGLDHDQEGSHALLGADLLRKYNEDPIIVNAVAAHHREVEQESLYATLTVAADAITAARPGARSETTEIYLKRLHDLEEIATSFRGVLSCFAIQAGRELRVIVEPHKIDDNEAMQMARNISQQIEEKIHYPGQVKVTVIRETRCVEYAR